MKLFSDKLQKSSHVPVIPLNCFKDVKSSSFLRAESAVLLRCQVLLQRVILEPLQVLAVVIFSLHLLQT